MTTPAPLPDGREPPARLLTLRAAAAIVAADYGIPLSHLIGQSRQQRVLEPRQVAMWLGVYHLGLSTPRVGRAIGGRDHSTVLHSARKIEGARNADPDLADRLSRLIERVDAAEAGLALRASEVLAAPPPAPPPADEPGPAAQDVVHAVAPSPRERRVCEAAGRFIQARDRLRRSLYTAGERAARQDADAAYARLAEAYGAPGLDAGGGDGE